MIRGVKLACIPVRDQARALQFYTERLGFQIMTDQAFGGQRWLELGIGSSETRVVLFNIPGQEDRIGTFQPITFWADNVEKTYEELRVKEVEFVQPPKKEAWGTSAIFKDLDGNQFVLSSR